MDILFKKSDIKRVIYCPRIVKVKTTFLGYRFEDILEESKIIIVLSDNYCYKLTGSEDFLKDRFKFINEQLKTAEEFILMEDLSPYEYYHHK